MMDLKDNTYEDIEEASSPASLFKSQSDSNLLRLMQECGQEVEIINSLIKGRKRPSSKPPLPNVATAAASCAVDSTFSLYGHQEPEQGFYKCHDSIYDVPEGQRIPDLMKKTKTKATANAKSPTTIVLVAPPPMFTNLDKQCPRQRRLSLDSGRGTSVAGMFMKTFPLIITDKIFMLTNSFQRALIC